MQGGQGGRKTFPKLGANDMHKKPFLGLLLFSDISSLKDTLEVDVQNLLALRLFLKSFLSGYNTPKYVLDFP
jgi:hypothetical protein